MDYKEYFRLNKKFCESLECFAIKKGLVNDIYYVAKSLLIEMNEKASSDNKYLEISSNWLNGGMTLDLKEALRFINYKDDNLVHFNAMCLLDSVSAYKKNTKKQ